VAYSLNGDVYKPKFWKPKNSESKIFFSDSLARAVDKQHEIRQRVFGENRDAR